MPSLKYNLSVAASLNVRVAPFTDFQSAVQPKMILLSRVVVIVTDGEAWETAVAEAPPGTGSAFKTI